MDHTLWDFETNSKDAISDLFEEFGLAEMGLEFATFHKVYLRCNEHCWDRYRRNLMKKDLLRHQRFFLALKDLGIENRPLAKKIGKRYVEVSPFKTALMPGAVEVLQYLHQKYDMHIITNGFQEIQSVKMSKTNLKDYFKHVITSEKVGRRKPEPRIFEHALKRAGSQPEHSAMIGDDLHADVIGATNVGIRGVWYNPKMKEEVKGNHITINHLSELKKLL